MRFVNCFSLPLIGAVLITASLAHAAVPKDAAALPEGELSALCGGFSSGGADYYVGINNQVSLGGQAIANSSINVNGGMVTTSNSGSVSIQANGGMTSVEISPTAVAIANSQNNVALSVQRNVTINLPKVAQLNMQALNTAAFLQAQVLNSFKNSLH